MLLILTAFELNTFQNKFKKFNGNKNIQANLFRIQAHNLVTCGYFCIRFIDFMLKEKSLTDFTNIFLTK